MRSGPKRVLALLATCTLALSPLVIAQSASSAELEDELAQIPKEISALNTGVIFRRTVDSFAESYLAGRYPNKSDMSFESKICSSMEDQNCDDASSLYYISFLELCPDSAAMDCIEKFVAKNREGVELPASLDAIQPSPTLSPYKAATSSNLLAGGKPVIFTIPGAEHGGGNRYALSIRVEGATPEGEHKPGQKYGNFTPQNINISVIPVDYEKSKSLGQYQKGRWVYYPESQNIALQKNPFSTCAIEEDNFCMNQRAFPVDISFQVVFRLRSSTNGWLFGKVQKPEVAISSIPGGERWELTAAPVRIPQVWEFLPLSNMPQDFAEWKSKNWDSAPNSPLFDNSTSPPTLVRIPTPLGTSGTDNALKWLNYWMPIIGDKATVAPGVWSIRNLTPYEMGNSSSCFDSKNSRYKEARVTGMVTSNAMITSAGPPQFDAKEQSLIYQVAGPHFEKDGKTLSRGSYDLIMRKDVARCLYNFTDAPIKASISVINANGEEIVATELISERNNATGEWVTLGKYGFTFSSPKIRVKLTQDKVAAAANPVPVMTSLPVPIQSSPPVTALNTKAPIQVKVPLTKQTITCVRGKTIKKVTGINPKCPVGYGKKS